MRAIIEKCKYLALIAIVSTLAAAVAAYFWGGLKTIKALTSMLTGHASDVAIMLSLVELMDSFLIATVLFIFAIGMYELFIGKISLPDWLIIKNLNDLKIKLSSVIVLIMGILFLKHLVEWDDPMGTMFFGIGVAAVSGALIAFAHYGGKEGKAGV